MTGPLWCSCPHILRRSVFWSMDYIKCIKDLIHLMWDRNCLQFINILSSGGLFVLSSSRVGKTEYKGMRPRNLVKWVTISTYRQFVHKQVNKYAALTEMYRKLVGNLGWHHLIFSLTWDRKEPLLFCSKYTQVKSTIPYYMWMGCRSEDPIGWWVTNCKLIFLKLDYWSND